MGTVTLIERLCGVIELQAGLIAELATALEQQRALTEAEAASIREAQEKYSDILGAEEVPE